MQIPSDSRVYYSKLGAKGFYYPTQSGFSTAALTNVERAPIVFSEIYGLIPVTLTDSETQTIYWIEKRVYDAAFASVERFPGIERL